MTNVHGHTVGVHDALTRAHVHVARARQILAGYLTDRYSRPAILAAIFGVRALAYLLLLSTSSQASLLAFSMLFGLVDYSVVPPTVSLVGSHIGQHSVGLAMGFLLMWHSLAASVGALMGGALFDASGSYADAIVVCALTSVAGSAACCLLLRSDPCLRGASAAKATSTSAAE